MKILIGLTGLLLATSATGSSRVNFGEANQSTESVSLISLIANPGKYDGKAVRAEGAFRLEFEGNALCLHREDLTERLHENCLWIEPDLKALGVDYKTLSQFNGKYVLVEGTFHEDNHGHMGLSAGAITGIWRVMLWSSPSQ